MFVQVVLHVAAALTRQPACTPGASMGWPRKWPPERSGSSQVHGPAKAPRGLRVPLRLSHHRDRSVQCRTRRRLALHILRILSDPAVQCTCSMRPLHRDHSAGGRGLARRFRTPTPPRTNSAPTSCHPASLSPSSRKPRMLAVTGSIMQTTVARLASMYSSDLT